MKRGLYLLVPGAFALAAFAAHAQPPEQTTDSHYKLQDMNFDMWCQEEQHLPADRCDKRLPGDEQAFEDYRDKVEKYEIPYLQERDKRDDYDRTLLHNDPVDNPTQPSTPPMQPINSAPPK